eukprot:COSAG01_NODE_76577_length_181_cov_130.487805_1_plen_41_part_10
MVTVCGGAQDATLAQTNATLAANNATLAAKVRCPLSPGFSC